MDGVFASGMIGFTQDYFTPFLLFLGGSAREVAFLTSLPNVVASLVQLKTIDVIRTLRSRKGAITVFVFLQALTLFFIALLVGIDAITAALFILLVTLFTSFNAIATPAWGSLMSDLVPEERRGAYFGWRNSVLGAIIVASSIAAGLFLHHVGEDDLDWGFVLVFGLAFLFRMASWYFIGRMHDPMLSHSPAPRVTIRNFYNKLKGSNFARFVIFVSLFNFTVYLAAPFFAVLMIRDLRFSYLQYSVVTMSATLTMYLMMGRWGRLADTIGNVRVMRFTVPIIAAVPLLWIISHNPFYLVAAQLVSGFAWAGFNLCASNFIYDAVAAEKRVRYISYFTVLNGIALSAGALAGGYLLQVLPKLFGYRILSLFALSAALRFLVCMTVPARLKEVRTVRSMSSNRMFFSMIGISPRLFRDPR
jgi:MFS family permease